MKPVLLGMNNPHRAGDPLSPDATAGRRLRDISGLSRDAYVAAFDRENLVEARIWSAHLGRWAAPAARRRLAGRRVVVLGRDVWDALGLPDARWLATVERYGASWTLVPHPSGRNRLYNDPSFVAAVRLTLGALARCPDPSPTPSSNSPTSTARDASTTASRSGSSAASSSISSRAASRSGPSTTRTGTPSSATSSTSSFATRTTSRAGATPTASTTSRSTGRCFKSTTRR